MSDAMDDLSKAILVVITYDDGRKERELWDGIVPQDYINDLLAKESVKEVTACLAEDYPEEVALAAQGGAAQ